MDEKISTEEVDALPEWERELLERMHNQLVQADAERLALLHTAHAHSLWWERDGVKITITGPPVGASLASLLDQAREFFRPRPQEGEKP